MRYKFATKYDILIGYTVFLLIYLAIMTGIGQTYLAGTIPIAQKPRCSLGFIIIDGLFDCAWQYLQPLFVIFDLTSTLGLINFAIVLPYVLFMLIIILEFLRGTG